MANQVQNNTQLSKIFDKSEQVVEPRQKAFKLIYSFLILRILVGFASLWLMFSGQVPVKTVLTAERVMNGITVAMLKFTSYYNHKLDKHANQ